MSSQGNSKPYLPHTYPDINIDTTKFNVTNSGVQRFVRNGVTITIRSHDSAKARFEPSKYSFRQMMFRINQYLSIKHGLNLDE